MVSTFFRNVFFNQIVAATMCDHLQIALKMQKMAFRRTKFSKVCREGGEGDCGLGMPRGKNLPIFKLQGLEFQPNRLLM